MRLCASLGRVLAPALLLSLMVLTSCASSSGSGDQLRQRLHCLMQGVLSSDADRREAAAGDLGALGAAAAPAVPALARALADGQADDELRRIIIVSLGHIGEPAVEAVPALAQTLALHPKLQAEARRTIERIGPPAEATLVQLLLNHPEAHVRRSVARLLASGTIRSTEDALLRALARDTDAGVRRQSAWALGQRPSTARVLAALQRSLRDQEWDAAAQAARSLRQLGAEGIALLRRALLGSEPVPSVAAAHALGSAAEGAQRSLSLWSDALEDSRWQVRRAAARAIGSLGRAAAITQPLLRELLTDPSAEVQQAVEDALAQIEGDRR